MGAEQRNTYRGEPARAWIRLRLMSLGNHSCEYDFLFDTGNPCAIIVGTSMLRDFLWHESVDAHSNFGTLEGGWLRLAIPELEFDVKTLGYASDQVVDVVKRSAPSFAGLIGLPLLRMLEYGGNRGHFWVKVDSDE